MVIWYIFPVLVCCNKKHLATLKYRMVVPWWLCIGRTPEPRDSFRHLAGKPKVQFLSYFLKPGGKAIYCLQPNAKAIPIGERIQWSVTVKNTHILTSKFSELDLIACILAVKMRHLFDEGTNFYQRVSKTNFIDLAPESKPSKKITARIDYTRQLVDHW
jgi:hypothetical protein